MIRKLEDTVKIENWESNKLAESLGGLVDDNTAPIAGYLPDKLGELGRWKIKRKLEEGHIKLVGVRKDDWTEDILVKFFPALKFELVPHRNSEGSYLVAVNVDDLKNTLFEQCRILKWDVKAEFQGDAENHFVSSQIWEDTSDGDNKGKQYKASYRWPFDT